MTSADIPEPDLDASAVAARVFTPADADADADADASSVDVARLAQLENTVELITKRLRRVEADLAALKTASNT
ncbi:hypothetical protein [Amycolatopsis sp. NPDC051102]|uniref:hypothetical protein n=1 Tax=Amycolatopsis sp. NPDC051102 TaxID=3155163 RepID=UPI00342C9280